MSKAGRQKLWEKAASEPVLKFRAPKPRPWLSPAAAGRTYSVFLDGKRLRFGLTRFEALEIRGANEGAVMRQESQEARLAFDKRISSRCP